MRVGITLITAAFVSVAGISLAQDKDKKAGDATRKELALLQGEWVMVGREVMGKKATKEDLERVKGVVVIKGNKVTRWPVERGKKSKEVTESTIKIDPTAKPKTIDEAISTGLLKGETALGIYKLEGDQLTVCIAWQSKERPTEFAGKVDGDAILLIYKRVKK